MSTPIPPFSARDPHRSAKQLHKAVDALEVDALRRVRAVHHELQGVSDLDVPMRMGLQKCQQVIARELGFNSWVHMLEVVRIQSSPSDSETDDDWDGAWMVDHEGDS